MNIKLRLSKLKYEFSCPQFYSSRLYQRLKNMGSVILASGSPSSLLPPSPLSYHLITSKRALRASTYLQCLRWDEQRRRRGGHGVCVCQHPFFLAEPLSVSLYDSVTLSLYNSISVSPSMAPSLFLFVSERFRNEQGPYTRLLINRITQILALTHLAIVSFKL